MSIECGTWDKFKGFANNSPVGKSCFVLIFLWEATLCHIKLLYLNGGLQVEEGKQNDKRFFKERLRIMNGMEYCDDCTSNSFIYSVFFLFLNSQFFFICFPNMVAGFPIGHKGEGIYYSLQVSNIYVFFVTTIAIG